MRKVLKTIALSYLLLSKLSNQEISVKLHPKNA